MIIAGVALAAAATGGVAYAATGKTATLTVDGQSREVDFRGDTAADVLEAAGLDAGARDLLVPSAGTEVEDGDEVALRRARELELVVDGKPRTVWVTAASVDEALEQVGLAERGLALSASRSRGIPLDGMKLDVRTPKDITITADGTTVRRTTATRTSGEALDEAEIVLDADDRLSHDRSRPVVDGLKLTVTRISKDRVTEDVPLPFATERKQDASVYRGETQVVSSGTAGLARRVVERVLADGKVEKRTVVRTDTVTAPQPRVVAVGTKARPAPARAAQSSPRSSGGSGPVSVGSSGGLDWGALAACESGGNPSATNPSGKYRGMYQFSRETWQSVGGSGDPASASVAEQTRRAQMLYNRSGAGQWPECGSRLR